MPINIFLSDQLPKENSNLLSIISFNNKMEYKNDILSVGMAPVNGKNFYEIWEVPEMVNRDKYNDINIVKNKNCLFGSVLIDNKGSYKEVKQEIQKKYSDFFELSNKDNMSIVKIWHYLPDLLKLYPDNKTNYSLLCEARERVYKELYNNSNYPAATVIGIEGNKILIYFLAVTCKNYQILENSRQVSSYNYPQNIFSEKPMFSRAVSFSFQNEVSKKVVISGTASIKGYQSMHNSNVIKQLEEALENYKTFAKLEGNPSNICRVYLSKKQKNNYLSVIEKLEIFFGSNKYILLFGDICRQELLIEIEGISDA